MSKFQMSREYKSRVVRVSQEFYSKNSESLPIHLQPAEDPSLPPPVQTEPVKVVREDPKPLPNQRRYTSMNDYFDKIICINLDRRTDRWDLSSNEFRQNDLTVERFSAIDGNNIQGTENLNQWEHACFNSHVAIMRKIVENGYNKVLILEDDIEFLKNIQDYFLKNISAIPNQWNMLYLGGNHLNPPNQFNPIISRITKTYTTGSYAVTKEMASAILKKVEKMGIKTQIDVMYSEFHKSGNCYSYVPAIAWQRPGYSDIQQGMQDYTSIIK